MKANEAPEKIYLLKTSFKILDGWYDSKIPVPEKFEQVEYTRTDALIEKACEWLKENKDKYLYNTGEKGEYIPTCSGKMIEEFRKYMEGE